LSNLSCTLSQLKSMYRTFSSQYNLLPNAGWIVKEEQVSPQEMVVLNQELKRPGSCLDLGCGAGRLFPVLTGLQQDLVGIDVCPEAVDLAQESLRRCSCSNLEPGSLLECFGSDDRQRIFIADFTDISTFPAIISGRKFDNALCMRGAYDGILSEPDQIAFANVCRSMLKTGGRLFLSSLGLPFPVEALPDGWETFELFDRKNNFQENGLGLIMDSGSSVGKVPQYYSSREEVTTIFQKAGFQIEEVYRYDMLPQLIGEESIYVFS